MNFNNNPQNNNSNKFLLEELGINPTYEHPRPYTAQPKANQPMNLMPTSSKNSKPQQQYPNYNNNNNNNMNNNNNNMNNYDNFQNTNMGNNMGQPPIPHNIQPNAHPQEKLRSYSNMSTNAQQQQGSNLNYNNPQTNGNLEQIKNWTAKNEEDLQVMSQKHEQLIGTILSEEEDVISSHRQHIDDMVELIKQVDIIN